MKKRKKIFIIFLIIILIITGFGIYLINNNIKQNIDSTTVIATVTENTIQETNFIINDNIIIEEEITPEKEEEIIMYTNTGVHMRDQAGLEGKIIDTLYINTEVTTIGEKNGWTKIKQENNIYYIKSEYLSKEKTEIKVEVTSRGDSKRTDDAAAAQTKSNNNNSSYLGKYKLTYYCSCSKCCGKSDGITASGKKAQEGITVASNSIPLGTKISIDGRVYEVQDRGGMASNVIDVFVSSHQKALNLGVKYNVPVYKIN